jgi:large subunit ribosomal protein L14
MIQKGSYLKVIDNSGVKQISCIHVLGGYRRRYAKIGDLITASVKSIRFKENMKVKKGAVVKALIIRSKVFFSLKKKNNSLIKHDSNAAVLLTNQYKLIGTRIFGGVLKDFRYTKFSKIVSLSSGFIR